MNRTVLAAAKVKQQNLPFYMDATALHDLVYRVAGKVYAENFLFEQIESENGFDEYFIEDINNKILIKATSGSAAAVAFNYYLKHICGYTVGALFNTGKLPVVPPKLNKTIHKTSPFHYRYLYNYCTFGYTYAFYDKAAWEKTLDWALLSGYNLILNPIAQESIWLKLLMKLGYTTEEAKGFLVGPAAMPWFLMMNMSSYDGNYPDWWFKERKELAGWFNKRLQSFGANVLLPGYCGMVPDDFSARFPNSRVIAQGEWQGYKRPGYILPDDPMFSKVADLYYRTQTEISGAKNTHYYSVDPFHEGGKSDGIDLAEYGLGVYREMSRFDPQAVWCFQSWQSNPKREILSKLDKSRVLVMNLMGETTFDGGDNFADSPWIYCAVNNFGGQHVLKGNAKALIEKPYYGLSEEYNLVGIGLMPEAVETDEIFYDIISEIALEDEAPDINDYLKDFINRRYGICNDEILDAWRILLEKVYIPDIPNGGDESAFCCRPSLTVDRTSTWGGKSLPKDNKYLIEVIETLLKYYDCCKDSKSYLYDLVDFTRQVFGNDSWKLIYGLQKAYLSKQVDVFQNLSSEFLKRFDMLEELLKTHEYFLLGNRIKQARNLGKTDFEKRWFEKSLRTLYTIWAHKEGDILHDYAAREYSGMVEDFYKPRWDAFISSLEISLATKTPIVEYERYDQEVIFSFGRKEYTVEPSGDVYKIVIAILNEIK